MKKFLVVVMLIGLFATSCYGAASEDMSVYVRQDVFDAKTEALFNRLLVEIEGIRGDIKELAGRMDGIEKRMTGLETTVYWILGLLSFVVGAIALAPIFAGIIQNLRKPSLNVDEIQQLVERLIDAKMSNLSHV